MQPVIFSTVRETLKGGEETASRAEVECCIMQCKKSKIIPRWPRRDEEVGAGFATYSNGITGILA